MEWRQIQAFHSIVRSGSMTRAAELQFRTQSALSQQIARLEEEAGCRLLERIGKKGFVLTRAGEEFYTFAEKVLLEKRNIENRMKELSGAYTGTISLAAPFSALHFILPDILRKYRDAFPEVILQLMEKSPQDSLDLLRRGLIDFAVIHGEASLASITVTPWLAGKYMLIVPHGHELTRLDTITLEDIARHPLNLAGRHYKYSGRDNLDKKFEEAGLTYRLAVEASNPLLNLKYTELGFGISLLYCYADFFEEAYGDRLAFISMEHILPGEPVSLVWRSNSSLTDYKEQFLKILMER